MTPDLRARIATVAGAVLAVAAFAAAYPAAAVARGPGTTAAPAWRVVRVPSSVTSPAGLGDVSATGPADAWAVGADAETGFHLGTPMILHWNGRAWAKVALRGVPRPGYLSSVSARSRSDAWALGTGKAGTILLHWNGRRWRSVGFPGRATAAMQSVAVGPHGTAWMVGWRTEAFGDTAILVERWNGATWHIVATRLGQGALTMVRVAASGDVWAAGYNGYGALVAHEHRGAWTSVNPGGVITQVNDVLAVSDRDVWVAGNATAGPMGIGYVPVIEHWNGRTWTWQSVPPPTTVSQDLSISPDLAGQPQWAGAEAGLPSPSRTQYAHFNGRAWSTVRGATALSGVYDASVVTAHVPGTNATWAVGESVLNTPQADLGPFRAIIEFNPG